MCWASTGKAGVSKVTFRPCDGSASQLFAFAAYGTGYTITAMSACKLCFEATQGLSGNANDYALYLNQITLSTTGCHNPSVSQIWLVSGSYPPFPPQPPPSPRSPPPNLGRRRLRTLAAPSSKQLSHFPLPKASPPAPPSALSSSSGSSAAADIPAAGGSSASSINNGSLRALLGAATDTNTLACYASAPVVVLKSGVLLTRSPNPPSPPDGTAAPDGGGTDLVLTKDPGSSNFVPDPSGQGMLFTLWLAVNYTELAADSAAMAAFKADMQDAMALAFKVPSSSITILDVSPAPVPLDGRRRLLKGSGDYVSVTMSATPSELFTSPSGWNLINNPLTYWGVNECEPMKPCLSSAFFTTNACECCSLDCAESVAIGICIEQGGHSFPG